MGSEAGWQRVLRIFLEMSAVRTVLWRKQVVPDQVLQNVLRNVPTAAGSEKAPTRSGNPTRPSHQHRPIWSRL